MKNHPHDSICGCSCDEVNEEMKIRFKKSQQSAEMIIRDDLEYIAKHIDTSEFTDCETVFAVVNTMPYKRNVLVTSELDIKRISCRIPDAPYNGCDIPGTIAKCDIYDGDYEIVDSEGNVYACEFTNRKKQFDYTLPDDHFRQPYIAERGTVSFEALDLPAVGYKVYGIRKIDKKAKPEQVSENTLENKYLKAVINKDGTIDLTDKATGKQYLGLMRFEDTGDIGSEYTYIAAKDEAILSGNKPAKIELVKNEEFVTEYKVTVEMEVPECCDEAAKEEKDNFTSLTERHGGRSEETVTLTIASFITLTKNSKRLDIKTEVLNNARDHRLRVLFPTGLNATHHKAETIFEAPERPNKHKETWKNPSGCEHQQGFVMMSDDYNGLAVANIGLYEYETVSNTIAVTLLRAVGEMGDWGVFPTELSQQQKKLTLEYSVMPYTDESEAIRELSAFQYPVIATQIFESSGDSFDGNILEWSGKFLKVTAFKNKMNSSDIIMRWANYSGEVQTLTINKTATVDNLYMSNIIEEKGEKLKVENDVWKIAVKPYEIITLGVEKE